MFIQSQEPSHLGHRGGRMNVSARAEIFNYPVNISKKSSFSHVAVEASSSEKSVIRSFDQSTSQEGFILGSEKRLTECAIPQAVFRRFLKDFGKAPSGFAKTIFVDALGGSRQVTLFKVTVDVVASVAGFIGLALHDFDIPHYVSELDIGELLLP